MQKEWSDIATCIGKVVVELRQAMQRQGWANKSTLTDTEKVYVAIAYNCGRANPALGFKQGHRSDDGRFYGENVFEFLRIAQSISIRPRGKQVAQPSQTAAPLPAPTPVDVTEDVYEVDVRETALSLRSEPRIDPRNPRANVIAQLPAGQMVVRMSGNKVTNFLRFKQASTARIFTGSRRPSICVRSKCQKQFLWLHRKRRLRQQASWRCICRASLE